MAKGWWWVALVRVTHHPNPLFLNKSAQESTLKTLLYLCSFLESSSHGADTPASPPAQVTRWGCQHSFLSPAFSGAVADPSPPTTRLRRCSSVRPPPLWWQDRWFR